MMKYQLSILGGASALSESQGRDCGEDGLIDRWKTQVTDNIFYITNRRSLTSWVQVPVRIPVARKRDIDVKVARKATPGYR